MTEEQLKILEDLRDEIPGFAPSTRKALDDAISELRLYGEMVEAVDTIDLSGDFGVFSVSVIPQTGQYSIISGNGLDLRERFGLFTSPLAAFAKVKEQL